MCLLVLIGILIPRLSIIFIAILTNWFSLAYETKWFPFLGFLILPYTTLAYMVAMLQNNHELSGWWLVLFVFAILTDLSSNSKVVSDQDD